jgi:hypothetical protein
MPGLAASCPCVAAACLIVLMSPRGGCRPLTAARATFDADAVLPELANKSIFNFQFPAFLNGGKFGF